MRRREQRAEAQPRSGTEAGQHESPFLTSRRAGSGGQHGQTLDGPVTGAGGVPKAVNRPKIAQTPAQGETPHPTGRATRKHCPQHESMAVRAHPRRAQRRHRGQWISSAGRTRVTGREIPIRLAVGRSERSGGVCRGQEIPTLEFGIGDLVRPILVMSSRP